MITPYREPRPHRDVAWLLDPEHVLSENGSVISLRAALNTGVQVWAPSEGLRELTRQGHGSAVLWRYMAIGWSPERNAEDWPVRGLALEVPDDPRETILGLMVWRDWLESHGAAPAGSLGGSGMSLVKATLFEPLWTSMGTLPPIRFTVGGRQETAKPAPAHYRCPLTHSDIAAAYAQTLGRVSYGGRWERFPPGPRWERIEQTDPGALLYARVQIEIPELPELASLQGRRGPLVVRPRRQMNAAEALFWQREDDVYPANTTFQGTWSMPEIRAAEAAGCRVRKIRDIWFHAAEQKPFALWLEYIWEGRELPGFASRLAKATGNATWGQFAIARGRRKIVAVDRDETRPLRGGNPSQRAFDLAEWIAGSVRADLYRGISYAGRGLVTAHTDGLWTRGPRIPRWRVIDNADEMRIFDAQCYATRLGDEAWEYCVAGVLDPRATFEVMWDARQVQATPTPLEQDAGQLARAARYEVPVITC